MEETQLQEPYSQHFFFFVNYKWAQQDRVLQYTWLERPSRYKHSSLLGPFISYKENMTPRTIFPTLHFLCNLQMGPLCYSVTLHLAGNAC
jgi:hypothetical protein